MKYNNYLKKYLACIMSIVMTLMLLNGFMVRAKDAGDDMGGYLWTFFNTEGGYEKIFFGYSEDGLTWQKINKDSGGTPMPLLVNDAQGSDLGVRDPHIIRSNDGTKYWILGTDLHAEGGGAGGSGWNQLSASKNIVVWKSADLIHWSEPKLVYSGFENAGCVWAPEAIYDEAKDEYAVYWSIRDNSLAGTDSNALRVYVCRTKDFTSFTTPKVWLSEDETSGGEVNIIDTTIVKDGEYYYRFSTSDWRTVIDRSKTLDTDDVLDVTKDRTKSVPNGSWERIVTRDNYSAAGFDDREGLTVYQLPDGRWCAMGDNQGYAAFVTDDLSTGKFEKASASFSDGQFRHGTVMRLTRKEDARIRRAFGAGFSGSPQDGSELVSAVIGTAPDRQTALEYRGTDDHTCVYTGIDTFNKYIYSYVRTGTDVKNIPVYFETASDLTGIELNGKAFENGSDADLSAGADVKLVFGDKSEEYVIEPPVMSNNSVLPGQYADPDIDYFDGKFWIFPTTDGYPGWSGTVFHAWSSEDMVSWQDEGIIMELANDDPGENEKGIQIASSDWAVRGSAWAPSIEKKNDRYYFYYCGKDSNGTSQIGVASADRPEGPYTDLGTPLITVEKCRELGISMGQAIDPSVFTDDDGTSYITFGNGNAAIVELGSDMMSIDESSMRQINGLTDFRESVVVIKRDGMYHWTWTCDDANSPNYHVNYGVSDTLDGNITVRHKPLLAKNENFGILGTGHQSMLHVQDERGNDRYYIAYHRFYTPVDIFQSGDGLGVHRETCIDEVTFDDDGYMNIVHPSHEGATVYTVEEPPVNDPAVTPTPPSGTQRPPDTGVTPTDTPKNTAKPKPVVKLKGKSSVKKGKSITVKVKVTNPNGSKVKWSLDKKGKKLFKIVKKTQAKVKLKAKKKKGTGKITVKYGNIIKVSKIIKVK